MFEAVPIEWPLSKKYGFQFANVLKILIWLFQNNKNIGVTEIKHICKTPQYVKH